MQPRGSASDLSIQVTDVLASPQPVGGGGQGLVLRTTRGDVLSAFHQSASPAAGVVWVWGARGGIEGPADGLYGRLAQALLPHGITSLRVDYRNPNSFDESVLDALAGVSFLKGLGYTRIGLVGHSFGGAVVIGAAPNFPEVVAVAALSSQTAGAQLAHLVAPRPLLLVHGEADTRLLPDCSQMIYEWAHEPKELVLYPGVGHSLNECREELDALLLRWLPEKLLV